MSPPPRQDMAAPTPPWFCLTHPTLKRSQTFQIRAQILKNHGNVKSQQEATQNSRSCPALSGAAPQSRCHLVSPSVTHGCQELWIRGSPSHGKTFSNQTIPATDVAPAREVTFQVVALGTKCPGASRGVTLVHPSRSKLGILGSRIVIPRGDWCHLRSPPSSQGSSGIGAVPISSGARNSGILGLYKPCQDPTTVWGSLLGTQ